MCLSSFCPIDIKKILKPFAIPVPSVILVLPMQNAWFVLDLQLSLPIICFRIFQDFDISFFLYFKLITIILNFFVLQRRC